MHRHPTKMCQSHRKLYTEERPTVSVLFEKPLHIIKDFDSLPQPEPEDEDEEIAPAQPCDLFNRPPPATLSIPSKLPKVSGGERTRAAIAVQEFEEKVIDKEADAVFSPMRLWTPTDRKKAGFKDADGFNVRLNLYYYVRGMHQATDPNDIVTTSNEMKEKAREERKRRKSGDRPTDLFEDCVDVYEEWRAQCRH